MGGLVLGLDENSTRKLSADQQSRSVSSSTKRNGPKAVQTDSAAAMAAFGRAVIFAEHRPPLPRMQVCANLRAKVNCTLVVAPPRVPRSAPSAGTTTNV